MALLELGPCWGDNPFCTGQDSLQQAVTQEATWRLLAVKRIWGSPPRVHLPSSGLIHIHAAGQKAGAGSNLRLPTPLYLFTKYNEGALPVPALFG